jgi:hypothetical protein
MLPCPVSLSSALFEPFQRKGVNINPRAPRFVDVGVEDRWQSAASRSRKCIQLCGFVLNEVDVPITVQINRAGARGCAVDAGSSNVRERTLQPCVFGRDPGEPTVLFLGVVDSVGNPMIICGYQRSIDASFLGLELPF